MDKPWVVAYKHGLFSPDTPVKQQGCLNVACNSLMQAEDCAPGGALTKVAFVCIIVRQRRLGPAAAGFYKCIYAWAYKFPAYPEKDRLLPLQHDNDYMHKYKTYAIPLTAMIYCIH